MKPLSRRNRLGTNHEELTPLPDVTPGKKRVKVLLEVEVDVEYLYDRDGQERIVGCPELVRDQHIFASEVQDAMEATADTVDVPTLEGMPAPLPPAKPPRDTAKFLSVTEIRRQFLENHCPGHNPFFDEITNR